MSLVSSLYCERCEGLGRLTANSVPCSACGGEGWKKYPISLTEKRNEGVLQYEDNWRTGSEGWPSTPYTIGKFLLCTKANLVPYGSYVVIGGESLGGGRYDYSDAVIRCATPELVKRLETTYHEMFVLCASSLAEDPAMVTIRRHMKAAA